MRSQTREIVVSKIMRSQIREIVVSKIVMHHFKSCVTDTTCIKKSHYNFPTGLGV
jgi:hypothetical protein